MTLTYNGGTWTKARMDGFIKSLLRAGSMKWPPKNEVLREARMRRGIYKCSGCCKPVPASLPPKPGNKRRIKNALVDHIEPIISPTIGFTNWDDVIAKMFCEADNLQVLCHECHQIKTNFEKAIAAERRRMEKQWLET